MQTSCTPYNSVSRPHGPRPACRSLQGEGRPHGFTLVELLIIILIIGLLIGILLPSIDRAMRAVRINTTLSQFNLLSTACELYRDDFDEYPESLDPHGDPHYIDKPGDLEDAYGKELIVLLLTGYAPDDGPSSTPDGQPGNIMQTDDGKSGFGFRTVRRGKVYGPYNGAENVPLVEDADPPVFADAFGRPILYYRATDGIFDHEDNDDTPAPDEDYIDQFDNAGRGFLFLSPGPNGEWGIYDGEKFTEANGEPYDDLSSD